jgi:hypothetical protein
VTTRIIGEVCSGAQTGVDFGSLRAAKSRGVKTGGVMPKGFKTNRGPKPEWAREFGLTQHHRAGYPSRTRANVEGADATVRIAKNFMSTGERCTLAACVRIGRMPLDITVLRVGGELTVDRAQFNAAVETLAAWARDMGRPLVVNFAGNSEETCPGIEQLAERVVGAMLDCLSRGA